MELVCPICGEVLRREEKCWRCEKNHVFDIARQGYVNLLPVQQKHSLHPGDTREQVAARRAFLSAGFYAPIADAVCRAAVEFYPGGTVVDVGCGEGYYSARVADVLQAPLVGVDISKEAVRCAAGTYKQGLWLCGTAAHLPVEDESVGLLLSLFAVTLPEEFFRVLGKSGVFLQVLAAEDHLLGLKSIIYPKLLHKAKDTVPSLPGLELAESREVRFSFTVEGEQVQNLLAMTPHVHRISQEGADRLRHTASLTDEASCVVNVYRKTTG